MKKQIYLDYNATVPLLKEVKESLIDCMNVGPLNASSIHYYGRKGKDIIDIARTNISELINANKNSIVFTGSATEAINLLFSNFKTIVVSSIEHMAVLSSSRSDHIIPVNQDGVVDLNFLEIYLNTVETSLLTFGVNQASDKYYKKPVNKLTREQSVRIALTLPNPKYRNPKKLKSNLTVRISRLKKDINILKKDDRSSCFL